MAKQIIYKEAARIKLKAGVDAVANAVGATMGPLGRNVALDKEWGAPTVTHDGVTVAKEVSLPDKFENMGAKLVLEAATKTNDAAGDGTTTATVLAQALVDLGLRNVAAGANPMLIRRGLEMASKEVITAIKAMAKPINTKEEKAQVATNSAGSAEIGDVIAQAMEMVGDNGVITVEEGKGLDIEIETKEGMNFDQGYLVPHFITDMENGVCELEDPYILLTDKKIGSIHEILPVLEKLMKVSQTLVVIAFDIESPVLATLAINKQKGTLKPLAIKAPGFGERRRDMLEDIAVLTGGRVITESLGQTFDSVEIGDLGKCDRIISTKDDTTIVGGKGDKDAIEFRVSQIRGEMEGASTTYDKEKLQERLAKLTGGVAIISVGGATEAEMKEKRYRVEDAINATQAAVAEGIVPGGGITLLKARKSVADLSDIGSRILYEALEAPYRKILTNAGVEPGAYLKEIEEKLGKDIGFNILTGKMGNLIKAGVIDPVKVTRSAIENAVSVAVSILTTDVLIADEPEEKWNKPN